MPLILPVGAAGRTPSEMLQAEMTPQAGNTFSGGDGDAELDVSRVAHAGSGARNFHTQRTAKLSPNADAQTGFVPLWLCAAYGAPDFGKAPIGLVISVHLLKFYQDAGVSLGEIAFITTLARCFDVLSDPLMANVTDATQSRWGRRRPYIFSGCFLYGICFVMLCSPPTGNVTFWFGLFYILFFLTDTLTNIPHNALGQEVTTNPVQRRKLFLIAKLFEGVGTLFAAILPAVLTMLLSSPCDYPFPLGCEDPDSVCTRSTVPCIPCIGILTNDDCRITPFCEWYRPSIDETVAAYCLNSCAEARATCGRRQIRANRQAMLITGLVFGGWVIVSMVICAMTVREKPRDDSAGSVLESSATESAPPSTEPPNHATRNPSGGEGGAVPVQGSHSKPSKVEEVLPNFLSMLRNKPFRSMLLPWVLDQTLTAMVATMLPFFVTYVVSPEKLCLRDPVLAETNFLCSDTNVLAMALVGLLLTAIASMPMWFNVAKRIGDYHAWIAFNALNALTNILLIFPGDYWPSRTALIVCVVIFACLNGLPMGAKFLTDNVLGICIDYDELRTGVRNEAAFTMFASFIPKVVSVPASTFPLSVIAMLGFREPRQPEGTPDLYQDASVVWGIRVMFALMPFCLATSSCLLKARYFPFKDLQAVDAGIKAGLSLRSKRKPYRDPLSGDFVLVPPPPPPEWLRALTLLEHFTGPALIEAVLSEEPAHRGASLVRRARRQMTLVISATVASLVAAIASVVAGLLDSQKLAWIPALLVLILGLCILCCVIQTLRLSAARALTQMDLSDDLLRHVLGVRQEVDERDVDESAVAHEAQASLEFLEHAQRVQNEVPRVPRFATVALAQVAGVRARRKGLALAEQRRALVEG